MSATNSTKNECDSTDILGSEAAMSITAISTKYPASARAHDYFVDVAQVNSLILSL